MGGGGAHHRAEFRRGGATGVNVVGVLGVLGGSGGADEMQMVTARGGYRASSTQLVNTH
jgi:hypothetical protein